MLGEGSNYSSQPSHFCGTKKTAAGHSEHQAPSAFAPQRCGVARHKLVEAEKSGGSVCQEELTPPCKAISIPDLRWSFVGGQLSKGRPICQAGVGEKAYPVLGVDAGDVSSWPKVSDDHLVVAEVRGASSFIRPCYFSVALAKIKEGKRYLGARERELDQREGIYNYRS